MGISEHVENVYEQKFVEFAFTNVTQLKMANDKAAEHPENQFRLTQLRKGGESSSTNGSNCSVASTGNNATIKRSKTEKRLTKYVLTKRVLSNSCSSLRDLEHFSLKSKLEQSKGDASNENANQIHCLIAEDNPITQRIAQTLMKSLGIQTTAAANGKEALKIAQETRFAMIFMDIIMPEMDGIKCTKLIRCVIQSKHRSCHLT